MIKSEREKCIVKNQYWGWVRSSCCCLLDEPKNQSEFNLIFFFFFSQLKVQMRYKWKSEGTSIFQFYYYKFISLLNKQSHYYHGMCIEIFIPMRETTTSWLFTRSNYFRTISHENSISFFFLIKHKILFHIEIYTKIELKTLRIK